MELTAMYRVALPLLLQDKGGHFSVNDRRFDCDLTDCSRILCVLTIMELICDCIVCQHTALFCDDMSIVAEMFGCRSIEGEAGASFARPRFQNFEDE